MQLKSYEKICTLPLFTDVALRHVNKIEHTNKTGAHPSAPILEWIDDCLYGLKMDQSLPLTLAGARSTVTQFRSLSKYPHILKDFIVKSDRPLDPESLRLKLCKLLATSSTKKKRQALAAIKRADTKGLVLRGLTDITKAVARQKVRRLYIAEDRHIWGVLDPNSGLFTLHPHQKNCQDDDILDDLAEIALKNRVELILLSNAEMPDNLPVLAISKEGPARPLWPPESSTHDPEAA